MARFVAQPNQNAEAGTFSTLPGGAGFNFKRLLFRGKRSIYILKLFRFLNA